MREYLLKRVRHFQNNYTPLISVATHPHPLLSSKLHRYSNPQVLHETSHQSINLRADGYLSPPVLRRRLEVNDHLRHSMSTGKSVFVLHRTNCQCGEHSCKDATFRKRCQARQGIDLGVKTEYDARESDT